MVEGDFPLIPKVDGGITTKVEVEALRQAITKVVFAAATDDSRPVLAGVDAQFDADNLTLAAADGFRLAVNKLHLAGTVSQKLEVIIPARAMAELNRLMADGEETIEIGVSPGKTHALFRFKNAELVSQLIQGSFPQYSQLMPQGYKTRTVVDVAELLKAARMASIFARDGSGIIRIVVTPGSGSAPGKMVVAARSEEIGDNTAEIGVTVEGEEARVAFNAKYLIDVLGVIREPRVALETTSPASPGVLRPVGSDDYIHVIMPMFVQWS